MFRRRGVLLALTCTLLPSCSGCSGDGPADTFDAALGAPDAEVQAHPRTCAEIRELAVEETGTPPDNGAYTLYVDGEPSMPWVAYCHGMDDEAPTEFLSVDESANYSTSTDGVVVVQTSFRRLRVDPSTLALDPLDDTFASTSGAEGREDLLPIGRSHLPAGWARFTSDNAGDGPAATAEIDLSGTPFALHDDVLADDLAFFCTLQEVEPGMGVGEVDLGADLRSFTLSAINPEAAAWVRVVCNCEGLGVDDDVPFTMAAWPLQYAGR